VSALSTNPKILITTAYRHSRGEYYDAFGANILSAPRFRFMRTTNSGVRFIKQNVPEIEILEFPLWHEYVAKLKEGWDIVGFSFFHHDLTEIFQMVDEARRQGIKEIWAGGYGAFSPEAEQFADRVFIGYVEEQLNRELFGRRLARLRHPPIVWSLNVLFPPTIPYKKIGILYTQRGCPYRCPFCQTPLHTPRPYPIPLESIDEVLRYYRSVGINEVWITDETFYIFPSHSEKVIDLLARYGFHWWVMTRLELCLEHFDGWVSRGMAIVAFGLESVHDEILARIGKKTTLEMIREFRKLTLEKNIFTMPCYIIGYEEDTVESVLQDYEILDKIGFDAYQLSILTPLPKLPMTERIESLYGIFDRDYHHYTAVDLVWHHPHITPARMKFLHRLGLATLNASANYLKGTVRIIQRRVREKGFGLLWDDVARPFLHSLRYNERILPGDGTN
jgi:radical SAM superfamily enzyme YgiQ (UPF0313 family)